MKTQTFVLNASYSTKKHGLELDSVIKGIVGRPETGASNDPDTRTMNMVFEFKDEKEAKKALSRLKKKKISAEVIAR